MLYKPKWLTTEWNIGFLLFTIASVTLAMFIQNELGLSENILVGIMIHFNWLAFILLAFILKPVKRIYMFLPLILLANDISASFWGMNVFGYNPLLHIHSILGFSMMIMASLGVDWTSSIKKSDVDSIFFLIFICGLFSCLYAMTVQFDIFRQYFTGADVGWDYTSFLGHRNQYSGFLYVSSIAALYLWQRSRKIIYPILIAIFFQNIVITDSRNAFFSIILFFGLYFVFRRKISLRTMIILGIPLLFIALFIAMNLNFNDIAWMFAHKNGQGLKEESRFVIWLLMLALLYEHGAFLSGFGHKTEEAFILPRFGVGAAHNTLVSLIFDGGIVKLIIYIVVIVITYRNICRNPNDRYKDLMKAGFWSFMFYSLFDNVSLLFSANGFVALMATIIFGILPHCRKEIG